MRAHNSSRLKKIEDKRNRQQALLFIVLTIGFLALVIFIGSRFFVQIAVLLGDLRSSSTAIENGDTIPPAPPRIFSTLEATSSSKVRITGFSEPGSTVTLINNGKADLQTLAQDSGTFEFAEVDVNSGDNVFTVFATDNAGNDGNKSNPYTVVFDDQPPVLTITAPKDGDQYFDNEREIVIAGETDEDANVRVNGYVVTVDTEGNFVKRMQLVEGENQIEVKAFDEAGNETVESVSVTYSR